MALSEHFLGRLNRYSPFLLIDGRYLHATDRSPRRGKDYLEAGDRRFALEFGCDIARLERFYRESNAEQIGKYKRDFIDAAIQAELRARAALTDDASTANTVRFVMQEVLPRMIDSAAEVGGLIGVQLPPGADGRAALDEILRNMDRALETQVTDIEALRQAAAEQLRCAVRDRLQAPNAIFPRQDAANAPATAPLLLDKVLSGVPVAVIGSHLYHTRPATDGDDASWHATVDGTRYSLFPSTSVRAAAQAYTRALQFVYAQEAITEFEDRFHAKAAVTDISKTALEQLVKDERFNYGNLGWVSNEQRVFVYWEIPKFAMRNPLRTDVYHPFPETKVAVALNTSNGEVHAGHAVIVDPMPHPFLRAWDRKFEKICILNHNDVNGTPDGIVHYLATAVNAFTNGLTIESLDRHGARSEDANYFDRPLRESLDAAGELTRAEALERGYIITNEWHLLKEETAHE